ncbi:MAG TPA: PEP-CTERM/exosortase system-associated acyltransferase [Accumulibacter sp.]|nr:PEP-CTERM/exosortase system-associated acyltransferase [Accumulibacter sp.]HMW16804.1 PEP-CTERM/exosortase system-associated acyltransferase [Accumulibacter sp.]HMX21858.1 PEP-CTERM/exosortase system-associated acyltransferase [Accumulibacter sp.]HMY05770.1 PEP-CTERM/exosortase system-associated acyltransferase [Accumulibacter sp.]HNC17051.1 PEP-CTERM/exosortase system-associated acyltransferase [Accumulibacter sp.]
MFLSSLTELTISQGYRRFFKVVPALSDELRAENYRIRHEVYCRELSFESVQSNGLETDAFDSRSLHCLVQSVASGQFVGCARLVLVDPNIPGPSLLPVEISCANTLDRSIIDPLQIDRSRIAEISRLAVIGSYRRRKTDQGKPISIAEEDFGTEKQPRQPYLAMAVYLCLIAMARHYGLTTLLLLTERRLAMNLTRLGVNVQQIGGPVEHRGERIPSMIKVDELIDGMNFLVRALFEVVSREVKEGLTAAGEHVVRAGHRPLAS